MSKRTRKTVTRAALISAFSSHKRSRRETAEIVRKYMGDNPVPPAWSLASVRGTFGPDIARAWAKKIRHLNSASFRDPSTGHWLTPVAQTAYDFGATPQAQSATPVTLGELSALLKSGRGPYSNTGHNLPLIIDEASSI